MVFFVLFGKLSDRIGRKKPIIWGDILTLLLLFPLFWGLGHYANPGLARSAERAPVVVSGRDCTYDPFASEQKTNCGKLLSDLTALGVSYDLKDGGAGDLQLAVGDRVRPLADAQAMPWADASARSAMLKGWLGEAGYDFAKQVPPFGSLIMIGLLLCVLGALSGLTYGSVAALLTEMFPPKIRYSSMSIPYHVGAGYLGGFLPLIASYIIAKTGNAYSGLWYTWGVVLVALVVGIWGLQGGPPREFKDD
jgi:MFS family permease